MSKSIPILITLLLVSGITCRSGHGPETGSWVVDTQEEWESAASESRDLVLHEGKVEPHARQAEFASIVKAFGKKRHAREIVFRQSPAWDNWEKIDNIGPQGACNAPVLICVADGDYWYLDEPGDTEGMGGYHAWHSTDMRSWTRTGKVTDHSWVTTAEYADGRFYIYYDKPNDEDPHLVIDDDLADGIYEDRGMILSDPSHGSDAGVLRDEDGTFHLIYEDWSPINARENAWDSPLAGHADSLDGMTGFEPHEYPPPIDERTRPTGEYATYVHATTREEYRYEIHEGPQNAFGDYTLFKVGPQYYLFCDYDPHDGPIHLAYWTSASIETRFEWGGEIGDEFHPDPTMGFAEGKFYLLVQPEDFDYVSPGPWVEGVEARFGVDEDGDGTVDAWTEWKNVSESYSRKPGFARVVEAAPARIDLSALPAGYGFRFDFRLEVAGPNRSKPIIDRVLVSFD